MMTSTVIKKQKSDVIHHRSHMTQIQGSYCKGVCRKHKSDSPTWSTSGVVYCRTCEIFLKKSGWFTQKRKKCKCCNHLVRSKPRQSVSKANFASKKQNNIEWTDPEDAAAIAIQEAREKQNRLLQEAEDKNSEKKSTPLFEEKVTEGKTYHEFRNFIEKEIKLQANYQLVMLKYLLTHKKVHKGKIAESLAHYNNKDPSDLEQVKEFLDKPVYKVLLKSGFVVIKDGTIYNPRGHDYSETLYELNGKFSDMQHIGLHELLDQKIEEWNTQHGILEFDNDNETFEPLNWRNYKNRSLLQEEQTIADLPEIDEIDKRIKELEQQICPKCGKKCTGSDKMACTKCGCKNPLGFSQQICPKCGKIATGSKEKSKLFKYSNGWCRECRQNMGSAEKKANDLLQVELKKADKANSTHWHLTLKQIRERQIQNREINTRPSSMASDPDKNYKENRNLEQKICPKCGKKANGYYDLLKIFGHRGKKPQSWCRECRSNKKNNIAMEESTIPPVTNPLPSKIRDRLSREASSAARWAMKKSETSAVSAKEYMQSTKQKKIDKIKEQLAGLRAKLNARENKQLSFPKAEALVSGLSGQLQTAEKEHDDILKMRREVDRVFSNDELSKKYGVGNMGGIRYSSKNNLIVLCDTKSGDFTDKIDQEFGLIAYTGEGRIGDQKMTGGNRRIYESGGQKTRIFYFVESESSGGKRGALDKNYRYFGQVKYVRHIIKAENDINGNPRKTIKFLLQKNRLVAKSQEGIISVLEPTVTTTKKSGGHKLKSCPICKKKVCSRLKKGTEKYWRVLGHKLKSCPICRKKVCPRLTKGHELKSCPICKKKVCSRLGKLQSGEYVMSQGKLRWKKK